MRLKQLSFDFGPDTVLLSSEVVERIRPCRAHFRAKRIKMRDLVDVLTVPERFWYIHDKKEGGKGRVYYTPKGVLREIHKKFAVYIRTGRERDFATAYWRGSSVVRNATIHKSNRSSLRLDLSSAFESIKKKHVFRFLLREFERNLKKTEETRQEMLFIRGKTSSEASVTRLVKPKARCLAWVYAEILTCHGRLRLGSPASPVLFNAMLERMDIEIAEAINAFQHPQSLAWPYWERRLFRGYGNRNPKQMVYTRYADDLCFSAPSESFPVEKEVIVREIISRHGFRVNEKKRMYGQNGVLCLPGAVVIDGEVRPERKYLEKIEKEIPRMRRVTACGHAHNLAQFYGSQTRRLVHRLRKITKESVL